QADLGLNEIANASLGTWPGSPATSAAPGMSAVDIAFQEESRPASCFRNPREVFSLPTRRPVRPGEHLSGQAAPQRFGSIVGQWRSSWRGSERADHALTHEPIRTRPL